MRNIKHGERLYSQRKESVCRRAHFFSNLHKHSTIKLLSPNKNLDQWLLLEYKLYRVPKIQIEGAGKTSINGCPENQQKTLQDFQFQKICMKTSWLDKKKKSMISIITLPTQSKESHKSNWFIFQLVHKIAAYTSMPQVEKPRNLFSIVVNSSTEPREISQTSDSKFNVMPTAIPR